MGKPKTPSPKKVPTPVATTLPPMHTEPLHAPSSPITPSTFPFPSLIPTWHTFNPHTKNGATGSTFRRAHHGQRGAKKRSDFTSFRLACCLEHVDKEVAGVRCRVRCMNVFTVDSGQCTTHGKTRCKDGPNRIYSLMRRGGVGCWGMLRDTRIEAQGARLDEWPVDGRLREVAGGGDGVDDGWVPAESVVSDKVRTANEQKSDVVHGKGIARRDSGADVSADEKGKGRKKGAKSGGRGMQLRAISEN